MTGSRRWERPRRFVTVESDHLGTSVAGTAAIRDRHSIVVPQS